ncbi:MAG: response regulator transcription factor [Sulfurimonadaceae bacterium]|jgi:DNA-binding response OmpR family regulator|nr:response regulator transcription factor [Arcobacteraceae bacterium]
MKILLLEDEYSLRKSVKELLEDCEYLVYDFSNGKEALDAIYANSYDLLLLDVNVPGMNGFELAQHVQKNNIVVPIIFMTSLTEIDNLEQGYERGCCDYVKKPFDLSELRLRVSTALRTSTLNSVQHTLQLKFGYEYDTKNFKLKKENEEVQLSKTEKMILELFIKNKNQIVTPEMITQYVWDDYVDPANVRVQINNLRKKVDKELIVNIRGLGYKLDS